ASHLTTLRFFLFCDLPTALTLILVPGDIFARYTFVAIAHAGFVAANQMFALLIHQSSPWSEVSFQSSGRSSSPRDCQ
ncbi:hypothetical protein, partial [Pseudomonas syringae]|uniref:hypothetical protein n=1 Tax=Pseudomonas syringae TaxID=317 RepID=UPI002180576C